MDHTASKPDSERLAATDGAKSTLEAAASHLEDRAQPPPSTGSAFDTAIGHLRASLRDANKSLDDLRAKLDAAG